MDFFGFTTSDNVSPIGVLIRASTDGLLLTPDWSKIMDICDIINNDQQSIVQQAERVILRRLQDSDHTVVSLSLVLTEACMKNCGQKFAMALSKAFLDEVTNIAVKANKGHKNSEDALRLIQEWGKSYESLKKSLPFYDSYIALKSRGVKFPIDDSMSSSAYAPSSTAFTESKDPLLSQFKINNQSEFDKLNNDLNVVFEQVRLCREMLIESPGIENDDLLAEIVGFLEACRDRMVDLIEAGTNGLLGEELFSLVLKANEAIIKTLEAERTHTQIPVDEGLVLNDGKVIMSEPSIEKLNSENSTTRESLIDFGISSTQASNITSKPISTGIKASVLISDDDDDLSLLTVKKSSTLHNTKTNVVIPPPPGPAENNLIGSLPTVSTASSTHRTSTAKESNLLNFDDEDPNTAISPMLAYHSNSNALNISNSNSSSNNTDAVNPLFTSATDTKKNDSKEIKDFDEFLSSLQK